MARPEKEAAVAEIASEFRDSGAVLLTEYRGLSVAQLRELRRSLAGNATFSVAKNKLVARAAKEVGLDFLEASLKGPTALAYVTGEPVAAAKSLRDFARANPQLVIKGGVFEGRELSAEGVSELAELESREALLARAAGALKAALYQAAYVFTAPAARAVRTVEALREKQATEA